MGSCSPRGSSSSRSRGTARIATLGEEVIDPARTIRAAIPIALGITLVVYATVATTALLAVGPEALAASTAPLVTVVEAGALTVGSADRARRCGGRVARCAPVAARRRRSDDLRDGERAGPTPRPRRGRTATPSASNRAAGDRRRRHRRRPGCRCAGRDRLQLVRRPLLLRGRQRVGLDLGGYRATMAACVLCDRARGMRRPVAVASRNERPRRRRSRRIGSRSVGDLEQGTLRTEPCGRSR